MNLLSFRSVHRMAENSGGGGSFSPDSQPCMHCGWPLPLASPSCEKCGLLQQPLKPCVNPSCAQLIGLSWDICASCGTRQPLLYNPSFYPRCSVQLNPPGLHGHVWHAQQERNTGEGLLSFNVPDRPQQPFPKQPMVQHLPALQDQAVFQHSSQSHTEFHHDFPVPPSHLHPQFSQESRCHQGGHQPSKEDRGTISQEGVMEAKSDSITSLPGNIPVASQNQESSTSSSLEGRDQLVYSKFTQPVIPVMPATCVSGDKFIGSESEVVGSALSTQPITTGMTGTGQTTGNNFGGSSSKATSIQESGNEGTEKDRAPVKRGDATSTETAQLTRKRLRDTTPSQQNIASTQSTSMAEPLVTPKRLKQSRTGSPDKQQSLPDLPSVVLESSPKPRSYSDTAANVTALVSKRDEHQVNSSTAPSILPEDPQSATANQTFPVSTTDSVQKQSQALDTVGSDSSRHDGSIGTDSHSRSLQPESKSDKDNDKAAKKEADYTKQEQNLNSATAGSSQSKQEEGTDTKVCLHCVLDMSRVKQGIKNIYCSAMDSRSNCYYTGHDAHVTSCQHHLVHLSCV